MIKVGITIGDINGVGLETILQVFSDQRMSEIVTPIVYGQVDVLRETRKQLGFDQFKHNGIQNADDARPKRVNLVSVSDKEVPLQFGEATRAAGELAFASIKQAVEDLASNKIDVLVTCPINKDTIQSDHFQFPGHTEYLADMAGVDRYLMLLVSDEMRVGVATGHIPLKDVSEVLTKELILEKLAIMRESLLRDFGIAQPHIAVLGLNPHAGDNGLLGDEEKEVIIPAIREARGEGHYVFGPYGADGYFGSKVYKQFDATLAMYHDQGLAPFKALAFHSGVNFTAGLPIVRTSPDHGTAYDLAGKGEASPDSLRSAIFAAIDIYNYRREHREFASNPLQPQEKPKKKNEKESRGAGRS